MPILSPREYQIETIRALERAKPPLVIRRSPQEFDVFDGIDNSIRAQAVAAYIDDHYSYARSTRGVEIWRRRTDAAPLNLNGYLARIRIPTLEELGAIGERSRVVFPSVGSLPGANGAHWQSDLTLHNPLRERMPLGLRYVAGDVRIDRAVTILGGQSLRWEDVVKSLFRAPEGSGVLWIEYRGKTAPVALLKTYDAARGAQGSVDAPLSMRDSATAGTDNADLTIVGIPGGAQRRVNLGIVNVGKNPRDLPHHRPHAHRPADRQNRSKKASAKTRHDDRRHRENARRIDRRNDRRARDDDRRHRRRLRQHRQRWATRSSCRRSLGSREKKMGSILPASCFRDYCRASTSGWMLAFPDTAH